MSAENIYPVPLAMLQASPSFASTPPAHVERYFEKQVESGRLARLTLAGKVGYGLNVAQVIEYGAASREKVLADLEELRDKVLADIEAVSK